MKHIRNIVEMLNSRLVERGYVKRDLGQVQEQIARDRRAGLAPDTEFERFLGELEDGITFDAPARLQTGKQFFTTEPYLKRLEYADWQNTDPRIQLFYAKMHKAFKKRGIAIYAHSAYRTEAQQTQLLRKKRSKAAWPRAPHCQGKAVDIVHARYHWQLTPQEWQLMGAVGKQVAAQMALDIVWGGDWKFYDPAHWEIRDWRDDVRELPEGAAVRKTPKKLLIDNQGLK